MNARAESVVTAEPAALTFQTRLIFETPELVDPFASTRLEVTLPPGSIVSSASGPSLVAWTTRPQLESMRLLLDFANPPIVGQSVDLQYELPIAPAPSIQIPPIPLLAGKLSSHQIALIANPAFQLELLTKPDPNASIWSVEPTEASFSLRKDRGLPIPVAAIELEHPAPLALAITRRETRRVAELEQALNAQSDSISWTGTARLESSVRPGFLYEFHIDPAVTITSASVVERDVERLSRFVRDGDRLLLVVGDDRLGTKNVRLTGQLQLEAGKTRPVPRFDLEDTVITRREIVVTSSSEQLLQIRRNGSASLLVAKGDPEWEPESPSSLRMSLPASDSDFELRWVNPASPLSLVEFLTLPTDDASPCSIEWRLESSQPLPSGLVIDAPEGTQVVEASDFNEEKRRAASGGRIRLDLQLKSNRLSEARVVMTTPIHASGGELPRLSDVSVRPVTYLAVPRTLLSRCEIAGDFLDHLPPHAPAKWVEPFHSRDLLVFMLTGIDWHVSTTGAPESLGEATAEILTSSSGDKIHGLTRLIISPSRAGVLKIEPPANGSLKAIHASSGTLTQESEPSDSSLLLRPSQPVALTMDWTMPGGGGRADEAPGPRTPGLKIHITYQAAMTSAEPGSWTPEILERPRGADTLAAVRLESLLTAARNLPIGVHPPGWLRAELQSLAHEYKESRQAGRFAAQVQGLLDSWSSGHNARTAPGSIAPESSLIRRDSEQALAEQMLVSAADPDLVVETPPGRSVWSVPRRAFNVAFITAWIVFWAFTLTKGGQWAARHHWADTLARHPGGLLVAIGVVWWLLLSPSPFGILIAIAGLLWELSLLSFRRAPQPPSIAGPSV